MPEISALYIIVFTNQKAF